MRTTLTLDDDVAARLRHLRDTAKRPFKELVNEALRRGLDTAEPHRPTVTRHTAPQDLGRLLLGDIDDVSDALAVAEGEQAL